MSDRDLETEFARSMLLFRVVQARIDRPRNSPLDTAATYLVESFRKCVARFEDHERLGHWSEWINAQANIVWRYNGYRRDQSAEQMLDDQKEAKRYLGYLVADDLLQRLQDQNECPEMLLSTERMRYLVPLSVEEFARNRAYFLYRERLWCQAAGSAEEDYQQVLEELNTFLSALLARPRTERCKKCRPALFDRHQLCDRARTTVGSIKMAKRFTLKRLRLPADTERRLAESVEKCTEAFYAWLGNRPAIASVDDIRRDLCRHFAIANMFEYFAICLLIHWTDPDRPHEISQEYVGSPIFMGEAVSRPRPSLHSRRS